MTDPAAPESPEPQRVTDEERARQDPRAQADGNPGTEPPATGSPSESIERKH
ncbi:MAG TPA: hypothetical protein VIA29_05680 [Thermoanaerobaculia bacterium]|jgi:hypothetical protein